ncbi:MAG: sodium:calcium antiporter [Armatimonadota bacterium]|nr:sodium:calcium antiporter [Armatimonadota bacterium]
MVKSVVTLIMSLVIILLGAELFTNGIEWFGKRLRLAEGAIGSVLAAVGTALPETMIPVMAFIQGRESHETGIGAIVGAPLMLNTLAFFVTGASVFVFAAARRRTVEMNVDYVIMGRDLRSFFLVYALAIGAMFLPGGKMPRVIVALFLILTYAYYVQQTFCCVTSPSTEHELGPLHFHREAEVPRLRIIVSQVFVALLCIVGGAKLFVIHLEPLARMLGMPELVLSSIIAPIATELPEKFNSITWIRQKKDTLALGNITGAMVFQSSIPPALGLIFTSWVFNAEALAAGLIAIVASMFAWAELTWKKRLSPYTLTAGIIFYLLYIGVYFIFLSK